MTGAPFHRKDQQPYAPCPVCLALSSKRTIQRELFEIHGLNPGEYADAIPATYLECPPTALDSNIAGMDAFRFQYSQMIRYSKAVTKHWRSEQRKRRILESSFSKERKHWRDQEADFKDRIAALEKAEAKLKKWEQRREMINHYLGLVGKMGEDVNRMRSQLAQVGLHVPDGHYAFEPGKSDAPNTQKEQLRIQSKSRGDSTATLVGDQQYRSSSSRKRRHSVNEEYVHDKENQGQPAAQVHRRNSRELMPPPLPRPRRPPQIVPSSSHPANRSSAAFDQNAVARPREVIEIYNNGRWNDSQSTLPVSEQDYAPSGMPAQRHMRQDYGALPFRPSQRPTPVPRPEAREERNEPYYVDDVDAKYQLPASSVPVPPLGFLSQAPRRPYKRQPPSRPREHASYARTPASQARDGAQSRISYCDADYGTVAQQLGEHAPRDMEGFRHASSRPHSLAPFCGQNEPIAHQSTIRPQHSNLQSSTASAASPFFKPGAATRPDTVQRPPARGTMAPPPLPRQAAAPRNSIGGYHAPPSRSSVVAPVPRINLYSSQDHYSAPIQSQRQSSIAPPSFRASSAASRYESGPQPIYQRADVPPSATVSYTPSRASSQVQRSRVGLSPRLPPSSGRVPLRSSFDPQLSRIPGVRGANASQMTYSRQGLSSSRPPPRSTYTAAGGRRSVLR